MKQTSQQNHVDILWDTLNASILSIPWMRYTQLCDRVSAAGPDTDDLFLFCPTHKHSFKVEAGIMPPGAL